MRISVPLDRSALLWLQSSVCSRRRRSPAEPPDETALIMMTILGCDDSVSQCAFVETAPERFVSIELCNAASENVLGRYTHIGYPTAVAVCQMPPPDITEALASQSPAQPAKTPSSSRRKSRKQRSRTERSMPCAKSFPQGRDQDDLREADPRGLGKLFLGGEEDHALTASVRGQREATGVNRGPGAVPRQSPSARPCRSAHGPNRSDRCRRDSGRLAGGAMWSSSKPSADLMRLRHSITASTKIGLRSRGEPCRFEKRADRVEAPGCQGSNGPAAHRDRIATMADEKKSVRPAQRACIRKAGLRRPARRSCSVRRDSSSHARGEKSDRRAVAGFAGNPLDPSAANRADDQFGTCKRVSHELDQKLTDAAGQVVPIQEQ